MTDVLYQVKDLHDMIAIIQSRNFMYRWNDDGTIMIIAKPFIYIGPVDEGLDVKLKTLLDTNGLEISNIISEDKLIYEVRR